ncbi:MAG: hypothetical protein LBK95_15405 [Bifidobacteriaceae bacterium]|nr:hypothetical protein [Bifidobacteriaceae bacterium]
MTEMPARAREAVRLKHRANLAVLDQRRATHRLVEDGYSPAEVSRWVSVPESEVAEDDVPMPLEGFSGATPWEICERYAAGEISREQLVDELVRYPYVPRPDTDGYDWLPIDPPGTFAEVQEAGFCGLIGPEEYGAILEAGKAARA